MARGTGITTRQMKNARPNAAFIWCNSQLYYPQSLARKLNREDLRIFGPAILDGDACRGREFSEIVLDHALELSVKQSEVVSMLLAYVGRRKAG